VSFCAFYERINWLIDRLIEVCNYVSVWSSCYAMAHLCLLCKLFADLINSAKNQACYLFLQATITHSRLISTYQELTKHCGPLAPTDRSYRSWQQVVVAVHWCCATAIRICMYSFRFSLHPVVIWIRIELSSYDNTSVIYAYFDYHVRGISSQFALSKDYRLQMHLHKPRINEVRVSNCA